MCKSIEERKIINKFTDYIGDVAENHENDTDYYFRLHEAIVKAAEALNKLEEQ